MPACYRSEGTAPQKKERKQHEVPGSAAWESWNGRERACEQEMGSEVKRERKGRRKGKGKEREGEKEGEREGREGVNDKWELMIEGNTENGELRWESGD